jgi:hypothetical protein
LKKKASWRESPDGGKNPKFGGVPENSHTQYPCWQLGRMDFGGPWSWHGISAKAAAIEIHSKLRNFESMTWAEILKAAGGRSNGNNSHNVPIENLDKSARDRLEELGQGDIDELFSLRLAGKERVWGIKIGSLVKILWYDPKHEVCPSLK